jgi:hypothetical protein
MIANVKYYMNLPRWESHGKYTFIIEGKGNPKKEGIMNIYIGD